MSLPSIIRDVTKRARNRPWVTTPCDLLDQIAARLEAEAVPGEPAFNIIKPGDTVLVTWADNNMRFEEVTRAKAVLEGRFPDVAFTFLGGATTTIVREDTNEGEPS